MRRGMHYNACWCAALCQARRQEWLKPIYKRQARQSLRSIGELLPSNVGIRCPHMTKLRGDFSEVQNYVGCGFLPFTKMPDAQRLQAYPVPGIDTFAPQPERAGKSAAMEDDV